MGLFLRSELQEPLVNKQKGLDAGTGGIRLKMVYGNISNLLIADRAADYHSEPHCHDNEQINYCVSGAVSIFVDHRRYDLEAGDFMRVRRNALHWAWSKEPSVLLETHTPGLSEEPYAGQGAVGLFRESEVVQLERINAAGGSAQLNAIVALDYYGLDVPAIERSQPFGRGAIAKASHMRDIDGALREEGVTSWKMAYGELNSLSVVSYAPRFRGHPRTYDAELLIYVMSGTMTVVVARERYDLARGDFLRVPRGEPHWMLNLSDAEATLFLSHSPGLQACPLVGDGAESLIESDEAVRLLTGPVLGGNLPRTAFLRPDSHDLDLHRIEQSPAVAGGYGE